MCLSSTFRILEGKCVFFLYEFGNGDLSDLHEPVDVEPCEQEQWGKEEQMWEVEVPNVQRRVRENQENPVNDLVKEGIYSGE